MSLDRFQNSHAQLEINNDKKKTLAENLSPQSFKIILANSKAFLHYSLFKSAIF